MSRDDVRPARHRHLLARFTTGAAVAATGVALLVPGTGAGTASAPRAGAPQLRPAAVGTTAMVATRPVRPHLASVALLSAAAARQAADQGTTSSTQSLPADSFAAVGRSRAQAVSTAVPVPPRVSVVGITWSGAPTSGLTVQIRTKQHGAWGPWRDAEYDPQEGPDPTSAEGKAARAGTEPLVVTGAEQVQARALAPAAAPKALTLDVVDPGADTVTPAQPSYPAQPSAGPSASAAPSSSVAGSDAAPAAFTTALSSGAAYPATSAAIGAGRPDIYSRAQWGADESLRTGSPSYGAVKAGFVHHTVDSNAYTASQVPAIIRSIYAYHVQGRGWSDIGYNFLVDRFGRIWEGRYGGIDKPVIGAHTLGFNTYAFAASAIGNFDIAAPPSAMIGAYQRLFAWKATIHQFSPYGWAHIGTTTLRAISGHRDVNQTACPGRYLYAKIPAIRSGAASLQGYVPALTLNRDTDNFNHQDVLGIDASGTLQRYPGTGSGDLGQPTAVGTGWGAFDRLVVPGDWTGDGAVDLLARKASTGELFLYTSAGDGGYRSAVRIGTGWNGLALITGVGDFDGDGHADLVARHSDGDLYLYRGNGSGGFAGVVKIGNGWQAMDQLTGVGDWDGDGHVDVVARSTDGTIYLYRGAGGYRFLSGTAIGGGWQAMTAVFGAGDADGNGTTDLYARKADGTLALYRTNGSPTRWARTDLATNLAGLQTLG